MRKYKAVIFDLDGTLLDTLCDLYISVNYALSRFGYPEKTIDQVRAYVGNGIGKLIERALPSGIENPDYEKVLAVFKEHYGANCENNTSPYPGIDELLANLTSAGIKSAVVSNKADFAVKSLCRRFFPSLEGRAIGEREGVRRKPAPDSVYAAMELLGVSAEESVYVGDSEVDVATAKNAGIDLIAVSWGFRERVELLSCGAQTVVDTAEALGEMVL